ncbi:MAG: hypothetical protein M3P92_07055, partial [Actinomycetota bacterium]|nr:hypothetical protein [Actinomycetota bacterium]
THSITDQASATVYALESETVDLDAYVGQRVTVYGTLTPGEAPSDETDFEGNGTLPSINVTRIQPVDGPSPDPNTDTRATFDFELSVEGQPPAGTTFFGVVPAEGCISVPLSDPDADGLYAGSLDVPRFPPGPVPPPDAEPVSLPVRIVQADSGGAGPCDPTRVIRDFGTVPADDTTFEASVNFGGGGPVSPEKPTDECLAVSENPEECEDHSAPGGSGSGSGGADGSSGESGTDGSGSDRSSSASDGSSGGGGSNSGSPNSGGSGSDAESGLPGGATGGIRSILPSTGGGVALWVLGVGILLVGSGLLVRRIFR